jgi:hypothetical protein
MSIQKVIQESIAGNPLEMKEALSEELRNRVAEAIAAKMEETDLEENFGAAIKRAESSRQRALKKAASMVKKGFSHEVAAKNHDVKVADLKKHLGEEVDLDEALDHEGLKKDFGDSDAKVHSVATAHKAPAEVIGHKSFTTDKGKVPVLKHYDRENFEHEEVPLRKGQKLVHDGHEHYHGYSDTHGHFRVHEDDMNKSHLRESMEELDESVSFKKTDSGDHHIHHNGKPVGRITKTSSMGSSGYSVRIGGNTSKHEVSDESSLAAAKDSAKWHLTSDESPIKMKEEVEELDELKRSTLASYVKKAAGVGHHNTLPNAMRDRATAAAIGDKEWYKQSGRNADNRSKGIQRAADRLAKEEVEKIDEISKSTLGSYATKALRRGDIANRMSKSDDDEMGKIANKRLSGVKKAVDKLADKTGKKALATSIKKDVDKTKAAGDAYTRKTGVDDHGKSYDKAARNIGKMRE